MISVGDNNISDILIEEDVICQVCKGEDVIFENLYIPPLPSEIGTNNSMNYAYLDYMNYFRKDVYVTVSANRNVIIECDGKEINPKVILVSPLVFANTGINFDNNYCICYQYPYPMAVIKYSNISAASYHCKLYNEVNSDNQIEDIDNNSTVLYSNNLIYPTFKQLIQNILVYNTVNDSSTLSYISNLSKYNDDYINQFTLILYTSTCLNRANSLRRASNVMFKFIRVDNNTSTLNGNNPWAKYKITYEINPDANSVGV